MSSRSFRQFAQHGLPAATCALLTLSGCAADSTVEPTYGQHEQELGAASPAPTYYWDASGEQLLAGSPACASTLDRKALETTYRGLAIGNPSVQTVTVWVKTGTANNSGTDDTVALRLTNDATKEVYLDSRANDFENGTEQSFTFSGSSLGVSHWNDITNLRLRKVNGSDDWCVKGVGIAINGHYVGDYNSAACQWVDSTGIAIPRAEFDNPLVPSMELVVTTGSGVNDGTVGPLRVAFGNGAATQLALPGGRLAPSSTVRLQVPVNRRLADLGSMTLTNGGGDTWTPGAVTASWVATTNGRGLDLPLLASYGAFSLANSSKVFGGLRPTHKHAISVAAPLDFIDIEGAVESAVGNAVDAEDLRQGTTLSWDRSSLHLFQMDDGRFTSFPRDTSGPWRILGGGDGSFHVVTALKGTTNVNASGAPDPSGWSVANYTFDLEFDVHTQCVDVTARGPRYGATDATYVDHGELGLYVTGMRVTNVYGDVTFSGISIPGDFLSTIRGRLETKINAMNLAFSSNATVPLGCPDIHASQRASDLHHGFRMSLFPHEVRIDDPRVAPAIRADTVTYPVQFDEINGVLEGDVQGYLERDYADKALSSITNDFVYPTVCQ